MELDDPVYAKMIFTVLEKRGKFVKAEDLEKPIANMEAHMGRTLMKEAATLSASTTTRRDTASNGGNATNDK